MSGSPSAPAAAAPAPAAAAPAAAPSKKQVVMDLFKNLVLIPIDKTALTLVPELGHLAPILFTMGSFLFAAFTLNPALAAFGVASVEAALVRNLFGAMSSFVSIPPFGYGPSKASSQCESNLHTMTPHRFDGLFSQGIMDEFPNTPLFYLSFGATYLIQAMLYFRKEMEDLGPQYSNRPYIAILAAALVLLVFSIFLLNYGCTGIVTILMTAILGGFVGVILALQNYLVMGKKGVNVLFIAPLERRTGMDFVCVTTNKST
jgi:hypothetical protein